MRIRFALLAGLLLAFTAANAQVAPVSALIKLSPEDMERGENGVQKNFYFSVEQSSKEKYKNAGFFGQRLRPYLAGNEQALDYLNDYRRQKWLFMTERIVFLSTLGVYGQQVLAAPDKQQYFNGTQQIAIGVAVASLLSNVFITRHTNEHLQRAVSTFNAEQSSARVGGLRRLTPSAVGLAVAASGQPQLALRWSLR